MLPRLKLALYALALDEDVDAGPIVHLSSREWQRMWITLASHQLFIGVADVSASWAHVHALSCPFVSG
jgi:hypothetical protein